MTKHHDESMALAALFDCWTPSWRFVDGPHGFKTDVMPALRAFGFSQMTASPFTLSRLACGSQEARINAGEVALLVTAPQLRDAAFLSLFRRFRPNHIILAAKSGLWWGVWNHASQNSQTYFHISTAEYIPSKNRA